MSYGQRKDGRWYVKYRLNGKYKWEYFGHGLSGERLATDRNDELKEKGIINQYTKREPTIEAPTFFELATEYLKIKASTEMTRSSIDALKYKLKSIMLPELGHIDANRLTHTRLDQYVSKRLDTPIKKRMGTKTKPTYKEVRNQDGTLKFTSRSTVHRELTDIQAILNWGVKQKYLLTNPVHGHHKPKRDDAIIKPPTHQETKRIIKHAAPHLVRALYISYFTGLRPGATELFRLTFDDVDFQEDTIFIISAKKKGPPFRVVPLHPNLHKKLQAWKIEDSDITEKTCREIIHFKGQPIKSIKKAFSGAKRRAGISRRLRMYDFRHAAITMMLSAGGDLKSVSEIAGHSRTDTTTKIYQHTNTNLLRNQINLIPGLEE